MILAPDAGAVEWKEEKGDHFIVYYVSNVSLAKKIRRQAEVYYNRIASDLGYPRYSNFWQWDNRVKIYVYPTADEFQKETGKPSWSKGIANYSTKEILTYEWSEGFLESLLPHEITHLIFRDFVGFKGEVPLWLDEGVAQWEEPKKREMASQVAEFLIRNHKNYPLDMLTSVDIRNSQDEEAVHFFYMQSVSLVDYLIRKHGSQSFTVFCRRLKEGKSLNEALKAAYPNSIRNLDELEKRWKKHILGR